jgi:predicted nucleotidyltransferase
MVAMQHIEELGRQIGEAFCPDRVILFGSYARGCANEDSDVDLLVILPCKEHAARKAAEIRIRVRPPFPVDILVRSPKTVKQRIALGDSFLRSILDEGQVLYEAHHA